MKIRSGFVSNSSSSSFIVAAPQDEEPKAIVEIALDYSDKLVSKQELDDYVIENWGGGEADSLKTILSEDYYRNLYNKCLENLKIGNAIYIGFVSSQGTSSEQYLYENGINHSLKKGTVISDCE